jgi:hypothetical protein
MKRASSRAAWYQCREFKRLGFFGFVRASQLDLPRKFDTPVSETLMGF